MAAKFDNPIVRWIDHRLPIFTFMHHEMHEYPTPKNLSYWWNFGSLAGIALVIMLVSGITLAMVRQARSMRAHMACCSSEICGMPFSSADTVARK